MWHSFCTFSEGKAYFHIFAQNQHTHKMIRTLFAPTALLLFLLLLPAGRVSAQVYSSPNTNPKIVDMLHRSAIVENEDYVKVTGDPYVDKNFQTGTIVFNDSTVVNEIPLRLNTYTDNIEFKKNDSILALANPRIIDHISFGYRNFIFSTYKEGVFTKQGYFEVLADGNTKLLLHRESIIKREQLPASNYEGGNYRDYFRKSESYYLKKGDAIAVKISRTKKSILKALGDHTAELEKFIKENHLRLSKTDALIDLIYYYNSLK